jgi:hypothetical protein
VLKCLDEPEGGAHTQLLGWLTTTVPSYWEPPSTLPDISLDELIGLDEGRNAGE